MAEEDQVTGRVAGVNRSCLICLTREVDITADKYCFQCEVFYCDKCAANHMKQYRHHRMTNIENEDVNVTMTLTTEPCPQHGKEMEFFCKGHDVIGCKICMAATCHRSCSGVVYFPLSEKDLNTIDTGNVNSNLKETIERLQSIKVTQQGTVTGLEADKEHCLQEINGLQEELIGLIEKIIQTSNDRVHDTFDRLSADLQHHHQEVEKQLAELEETEKRLKLDDDNEVKLFIKIKKCQQQLRSAEKVSTKSFENLKIRGFTVAVDERLQNLLGELESLVIVLELAPARLSRRYRVDISTNEDKNVCDVFGVCVLTDNSILLAEWNNKLLRRICQNSHRTIDQCALDYCPGDVCCTSDNQVATVQQNKSVVFVTVKPTLTPTRTMKLDHYCAYIACVQNKIFIADSSETVYIYNMAGDLLKKISTSPSGQELFSRTGHITVDETTGTIYVADLDKGLLTLNREGNLLDTLLTGTIRGTYGVCLDGAGGLFVCGYWSHNVLHVGPDGRILAKVLTKSDGLNKPLSICYDKINKRLLVSQVYSNELHGCDLEQKRNTDCF